MKWDGAPLKQSILALGVCASLAAGTLGFGGSAEARVAEADRTTIVGDFCGRIQDSYDAAVIEARTAFSPMTRQAAEKRRDAFKKQYSEVLCDVRFGPIEYHVSLNVLNLNAVDWAGDSK
jgi:hypothetical protein